MDKKILQPRGRTEKRRGRDIPGIDFRRNASRRETPKAPAWMRKSMIPNRVPARANRGDFLREPDGALTDNKKRGARLETCEQLEHPRRVPRIRSIVDR